jgi:tripartite-type tricarboxylate transporter receptor subunit TctC
MLQLARSRAFHPGGCANRRNAMTARNACSVGVAAAAMLASVLPPGPAQAQEKYPERSIRLMIPFPAGGGTDVMGRHWEAKISPLLGQQLIVDNKTGAGGAIGAAEVARARPDGYTLLLGTSSTHVINPLTMENLPYDAVKSFAPITVLAISTYLMVAHPSVASSLPELIRRAKASPGKYSYGAVSGMAQFSAELFKKQARIDIVRVPYRMTGQNLQDLMGGQIPLTSTILSVAAPHHRSGKLRILAVFGEKRSNALPEVPTAIECGVAGTAAYTFNVLFAPAGTPKPLIDLLYQTAARVTRDQGFQKSLDSLGIEPVTDSSPEKAAQLVKDEIAKWAPIVRATGMKMD